MTAADRIQIEPFGRWTLLRLDFAHVSETDEALAAIEHAKLDLADFQPESVVSLADVTGSHFTHEVLLALRGLLEHNRPLIKEGAIYGLNRVQHAAMTILLRATGRRNLHVFDRREAAESWLRTLA